MFRLLEPANYLTPPDAQHVEFSGKRWVMTEYAHVSDAPKYTCISYAWGKDKTENPFCNERSMSTRTLGAIETAISVSHSPANWSKNISFSHNRDALKEVVGQSAAVAAAQAFWVDALCVPGQEPARTVCLQSMGEIFSATYQVIVVLTEQCSKAIENTSQSGKLDSTDLRLLENEDWVSRAWTYQEAVNSERLYFAVEDNEDAIISGHDFLNAIMIAIDEYKLSNNIGNVAWEKHHQKLRSLERLLADYLISNVATRSAYQVMSVMERRVLERAEDYYYAMTGTISTKYLQVDGYETIHPSEYFMRVCEEKGDFSFIYSAAARNETMGRLWRPLEGRFPALLPDLITFGGTEAGHMEQTHLQLNNMYRLIPGRVTFDGLKAARWFVDDKNETHSSDYVASQVLKRLRILGFSGCGDYLEFETGFFFPQSEPLQPDGVFAVVSQDIHWVTGGPGLLLRANSSDINDFNDVGAFVGRRAKSGDRFKVG